MFGEDPCNETENDEKGELRFRQLPLDDARGHNNDKQPKERVHDLHKERIGKVGHGVLLWWCETLIPLLKLQLYAILSSMSVFTLRSEWEPAGDQPEAIREITEGFRAGHRYQTLLGVTGSGKTFTAANVIAQLDKPTLVIAHNKTLAAQLAQEYRQFFPENAVHYFVSYYDYYQPEAYLPTTDTYIEKDAQINEEIDRLRHASTQALLSRRDVIIVASVSCI